MQVQRGCDSFGYGKTVMFKSNLQNLAFLFVLSSLFFHDGFTFTSARFSTNA